jgi:mRNA deadenylase 3'-5' endonuclease subunit Ccr4
VLSFNVLADCFVRVEGQPWNAFAHCDDAHLAWERRLPSIIRLLQTSAADVICLQEVSLEERATNGGPVQWALPAWTEELLGYTGVMQGLKQKEWEKTAERNERVVGRRTVTGVATFYRTERFEEMAPSKYGSTSGLAVFLRCRDAEGESPPLELAVGNVHLVGDPCKAGEHVKTLTSLKKNLGKQDHRVICGDFNNECTPDGAVTKWAAEEGFRDAPTGPSWAEPGRALRLDHILHTASLRALAVSDPLSPEEVATGLPCESCPSDHSPVAVVFAGVMRRRCPW